MRIRMKATSASPAGVLAEGQEYDLGDEEAQDLIEVGAADPVKDAGVEVADSAPAETPEGGGEGGRPNAAQLKAEIAESADEARLNDLAEDDRKTVSEAALNRLADLEEQGGGS